MFVIRTQTNSCGIRWGEFELEEPGGVGRDLMEGWSPSQKVFWNWHELLLWTRGLAGWETGDGSIYPETHTLYEFWEPALDHPVWVLRRPEDGQKWDVPLGLQNHCEEIVRLMGILERQQRRNLPKPASQRYEESTEIHTPLPTYQEWLAGQLRQDYKDTGGHIYGHRLHGTPELPTTHHRQVPAEVPA